MLSERSNKETESGERTDCIRYRRNLIKMKFKAHEKNWPLIRRKSSLDLKHVARNKDKVKM